jgi:hypothetical protein
VKINDTFLRPAAKQHYRATFMAEALMQTARIRWTGHEQFLGITPSNHAVPFDSDRKSNVAPGPMDMLLIALGACTATGFFRGDLHATIDNPASLSHNPMHQTIGTSKPSRKSHQEA